MRKILLTAATIAMCAAMWAQTPAGTRVTETPAQYKLRAAENMIENLYVDEVNADSLVEAAIRAMLTTLDPHSNYLTPDEARSLEEPLQGNFSGIGISFLSPSDTVVVTQTIAGGPAQRAGIKEGDHVIMVNDTVIAGVKMPRKEVMGRIRGPKGSQVKITVMRLGEKAPIDFNLIRDDIPIYSVEASYMVNPETGYIRLLRFAEDTPREIEEAMAKLRKQGMKHLIIDLQGNGGGYLTAATAFAEMMLDRGDRIVFTQSSRTNPRYYVSGKDGTFTDGRVVVLVDAATASASEILSGALQDNDRGLIVGRRTFGKGLVQRPIHFNDGSMMRLTISRYYTPSGRCIQKPYKMGDKKGYDSDMRERLNSGELMNADSVHHDSSQLFHTRGGRVVYGGGGITPDRFVPLDTTYFTPYYRNVIGKSTHVKYTLKYVDENRARLKKQFKNEAQFLSGFSVTPDMLKDFIAMAEADGVKFDQEQYDTARPYLEAVIKAFIGRDLYDQSTYYKVMNPMNPIYSSALRLINDEAEYNRLLGQ